MSKSAIPNTDNIGHICLFLRLSDSTRSQLESSTSRSAITVRTRTKLGGPAFSVSEPNFQSASANTPNVLNVVYITRKE